MITHPQMIRTKKPVNKADWCCVQHEGWRCMGKRVGKGMFCRVHQREVQTDVVSAVALLTTPFCVWDDDAEPDWAE